MEGEVKKAAWVLSIAILISSVILCVAIVCCTAVLSKSLQIAGEKARSTTSVGGTSFPSELLVHVSEPEKTEFAPEMRQWLIDSFIEQTVGKQSGGKLITSVEVKSVEVKGWGNPLRFTGDIVFEDGSKEEWFDSYLYRDGFGGYDGFIRKRDGGNLRGGLHIGPVRP